MHIPVFKNRIAELLNLSKDAVVVDATLGAGGHSFEIWEQMISGKLVSFDVDKHSIERLVALDSGWQEFTIGVWALHEGTKTWYLANANFKNIATILRSLAIHKVDVVLADLGWSTDQLGAIAGLSYSKDLDAQLDMRFSPELQVTAADLLNNLSRDQLKTLFEGNADIYGKQCFWLIDKIVQGRPLSKVSDLLKILEDADKFGIENLVPRVFQALRIAVNSELSTLQSFLSEIPRYLGRGGRLMVITFHSGEEKVVERLAAEWQKQGVIAKNQQASYLRPTVDELKENISARSAKLYIYEFLR